MTKAELLVLYYGLSAVNKLRGVKFSYAVAKNLSNIESEIEALRKASAHTPESAEYENKRVALCKDLAKKDEEENPITEGGVYVAADPEKMKKALEELAEENKEVVEARSKVLKEYYDLLKEDAESNIYMVDLEYVPEEISVDQMNAIHYMIREDD